MEFMYNNYLINYTSNIDDFRINVYNQLNNKKYELIESELVKKYKDIGIDVFGIITESFANTTEINDNTFKLVDHDTYITITFIHGKLIKISVIIPNILCEYKDASILDLKTKIIKLEETIQILKDTNKSLQQTNKIFEQKIDELSYEVDIGNYVKVPKKVDSLVICEWIGGIEKNYYNEFIPISINNYQNKSTWSSYGFPVNKYKGIKNCFHSSSHEAGLFNDPSPNEFYHPNKPFLCFTDEIDCEKISELKLTNLGLYNIKISNINKLTNVTNLYLYNVEIIDDNTFYGLKLKELGIKCCKNISSELLQSIKTIFSLKSLAGGKIYILGSNIIKTDLAGFTVIEV